MPKERRWALPPPALLREREREKALKMAKSKQPQGEKMVTTEQRWQTAVGKTKL